MSEAEQMSERRGEKRPFRILMIAPTSFFSDYGGHIRILEETRTLLAMGHQVRIVTYYKGSNLPGLDIRRTPPCPGTPNMKLVPPAIKSLLTFISLFNPSLKGFV